MLEDLIILDLSRVLAGPYCTQLLADLGATVWKLEPPGGDETRAWGPPFVEGESAYFLSVNRNKQGLAINLKDPRGARLTARLAERADALVENFKTGDLARYGLDYETLNSTNPRLVYVSITGYGHSGPRSTEPGYDAAIQAASGLMAMTGEPEGEPVKLGVAWVDVLAGLHAATGMLAALRERDRTGRGKHLDIALFDVALASMVNQGQSALLTGQAPERLGSAHPSIVPYQTFPTATGGLMLAVGNDRQFRALCSVLDIDDPKAEERFATNRSRVEHRSELVPLLARKLSTATREEWLPRLRDAGVPAAPVNTLTEALADRQAAARGMVTSSTHERAGEIPLLGSPFGSDGPVHSAPPTLGCDTRSVLVEQLGLSDSEFEALERDEIVVSRKG